MNGFNGFISSCNCGRNQCMQDETDFAGGQNAYASIYNIGSEEIVVAAPGDIVPITFSGNALLGGGVTHEPGTAEITVPSAGDYEINFTLYFSATVASFATFAIQHNGANLPGGVFSKMLSVGYQTFLGSTMATLDAGDNIRIVFSAPIVLGITLQGNDVTAVCNIKKIN